MIWLDGLFRWFPKQTKLFEHLKNCQSTCYDGLKLLHNISLMSIFISRDFSSQQNSKIVFLWNT